MDKNDLILRTIDVWEKGAVDNPLDSGGQTKYGISKRWHPDVDIPNLMKDQAVEIYTKEYWNPLALDTLHPRAAWKCFDTGVLCGLKTARDLKKLFIGQDDIEGAMNVAIDFLTTHFHTIVDKNPPQKAFLNGWLRRAADRGEDIT